MLYDITPIPKPRMTQRDKWAKRPSVMRYRAFCDECRLKVKELPNRFSVTFSLPMPKSWPTSKKTWVDGLPHQQTPDLDNLIKALKDALRDDDSDIYEYHAKKVWSYDPSIEISEI